MKAILLDVIQYVRDHAPVQPDELAEHFGMSRRTIRNYVRRANEELDGCARIASARGGGYRLEVFNECVLAMILRAGASDQSYQEGVLPQTSEERTTFLLNDLLARNSWITIEDLASVLYVSPRTISNDLREVESRLAAAHLTLEKRPHYGVRVVGSEFDRRLALAANVATASLESKLADGDTSSDSPHAIETSNAHALLGQLQGAEGTRLIQKVAACVERALRRTGLSVNALSYQNLLVHIAIALLRIRECCYVPMALEDISSVQQRPEYSAAREMANDLEATFAINLPEEEVCYIAIHLAAKQELPFTDSDACSHAISDEVWDLTGRMLDVVNRDFRFDLRQDLELKVNLARHIVPLSARLRFGMISANPLVNDIKARFPLAWSMAFDAASVLASHYQAEVSDDEVGYLALSFALALERQNTGPVRKNVLVVCASGAGSARLLEWQIRQEFGTYLGEVRVCNVLQARDADLSNIDYIFSTVPLTWTPPVPVRLISALLDERDIQGMQDLLQRSEQTDAVLSRFSSQLFFARVSAASSDNVISFMCSRLRGLVDVPENFEELVFERERVMSTAMGGNVAMPHPILAVSERTFVCVAILDRPVKWGERFAQAIFLVSVSRYGTDEAGLNDFYEVFSRLLINSQAIRELIQDPRFEKLVELIRSISTNC